MSDPDDDEIKEVEWIPEDPAPTVPWGRSIRAGELITTMMAVAALNAPKAEQVAKVVEQTAIAKFAAGKRSLRRCRVHVDIPQGVSFDVVVSLPPPATSGVARRKVGRELDPEATFRFVHATARIRPSSVTSVRSRSVASPQPADEARPAVGDFGVRVYAVPRVRTHGAKGFGLLTGHES